MAQNKIEKIFIIGGSSGSLNTLLAILPRLHSLATSVIIIVLHRKNSYDTALIDVFAARTKIVIKEAEEKEEILEGNIYIAPADYHLLIEKNGTFSLDVSEKINYSRPSIDVSFETAAEAFGKRVTGILLSGANADGTKGLQTIQYFGGTAIAQQPDSAEVPYMPQKAIDSNAINFVMTPDEIAAYINRQ